MTNDQHLLNLPLLDLEPEHIIKENYNLVVFVVTYIGTGSRFTLPVPGSRTRVADPHHVDADPDPACRFDADPDPDPACHFDANPDPDPCFQIKAQNLVLM